MTAPQPAEQPRTERLDSKGRRVGGRAMNGPGKREAAAAMASFPKRNERGLCIGLEDTITDTATMIETLVLTLHEGHGGDYRTCPRQCGVWRSAAEKLRAGLLEWTGQQTNAYEPWDGYPAPREHR